MYELLFKKSQGMVLYRVKKKKYLNGSVLYRTVCDSHYLLPPLRGN